MVELLVELLAELVLQLGFGSAPGASEGQAGRGRGAEGQLRLGRQPAGQPQGVLGRHHAERIEPARLPLTHQQLAGAEAGQPALEPAAAGQAAEPQHLGAGQGGRGGVEQQVVGRHAGQVGLTPQPGEGIGQHGPAAAALPAHQGIEVLRPGCGAAPPGAGHHQAGAIGVEAGHGVELARIKLARIHYPSLERCGFLHSHPCHPSHPCRPCRPCRPFRHQRAELLGDRSQAGPIGMERFFKRQVEVHRPRWQAAPNPQAGGITLPRQSGDRGVVHGGQAVRIALAKPAAAVAQEGFLVHALVGATALEPLRPIGAEQ